MRFLVLEQNPRVIKTYKEIFSQKDFEVDFVETGQQCLEKFSLEYDYVILERTTDLPSGEKLEDQILIKSPTQKIFFLSPYMDLENPKISRETQEIVEKPFALVTLLGKILIEQSKIVIKVK